MPGQGVSRARYASGGWLSIALRGCEARLQRGHQILRGFCLDRGDRGELLAFDLRLNELHECVPVSVVESRQVELHRQRLDELERQVDLCLRDHDRLGSRWLRRGLQ